MIEAKRVTVGTATIELVPPHTNPQMVRIVNTGGEVLRVGTTPDFDLESSYGVARLPDSPNTPRTIWEFKLGAGDSMWGFVAANTVTINVWIEKK